MIKSIRILLLLALIQISLSSCLLWKGAILTLKQSSAYFLVFIVLASCLCAGMNFFYTQDQDCLLCTSGKKDHLLGLKENVIIGKIIPAGTGMARYRNLEPQAVNEESLLADSQEEQVDAQVETVETSE